MTLRRILQLVFVLCLLPAAVAGPRPFTAAAAGEYVGECSGLGQAKQCLGIEVQVASKALPGNGFMVLSCIRRSGGCISWRIDTDGQTQGNYTAHPPGSSFVGRCVVRTSSIPDDGANFGTFAGGWRGFLDTDCNGVFEVADRRVPANSFATITPGAGFLTGALLANITMVDATGSGYVSTGTCQSMTQGPQSTSSGNHGVGSASANLSVIQLGTFQQFCLYNSAPVHVLIDTLGEFRYAGDAGSKFVPQAPTRLLDTRQASPAPPPGGSITRVQTGTPPGTRSAMVNLTMTGGEAPGYITAGKCSALVAGPQSQSSGNFGVATDVSNLGVVALDPDGSFCIYNSAPVHLVVDLQGLFVPHSSPGQKFGLLPASRRLDTRGGQSPTRAGESITRVVTGVPAGSTAALVNLTMVGGGGAGYITADLCSALSLGAQTKSTGNFGSTAPIANLAAVPVAADGSFCIYNSAPVDLIVDVQGAFSPTGDLEFFPSDPQRLVDSRIDTTATS